MNKVGQKIIPVILMFWFSYTAAQTVENVTYKVEGGSITITYDIIGDVGEFYFITIYSSADNFNQPIISVVGDVGRDISPGRGKSVKWDAKKDLGDYKGRLSLTVRAELIAFIEFSNITAKQKFKKGTSNEITWTGGPRGNIKLELYDRSNKVAEITNTVNTGRFTWVIPKKFESGKTFKIRASSGDRASFSPEFQISGKMPIWMIAIPVVVIGGVIALLAGGDNGGMEKGDKILDPLLPN